MDRRRQQRDRARPPPPTSVSRDKGKGTSPRRTRTRNQSTTSTTSGGSGVGVKRRRNEMEASSVEEPKAKTLKLDGIKFDKKGNVIKGNVDEVLGRAPVLRLRRCNVPVPEKGGGSEAEDETENVEEPKRSRGRTIGRRKKTVDEDKVKVKVLPGPLSRKRKEKVEEEKVEVQVKPKAKGRVQKKGKANKIRVKISGRKKDVQPEPDSEAEEEEEEEEELVAKLEVCVDNVTSAKNAEAGGASRIELCNALSCGGLTPSVGLLRECKRVLRIPVFCMIRPREGDFVYQKSEVAVMENDIEALKKDGADGFVFGALTPDAIVDEDVCTKLLKKASSLPCTFHRAFDYVDNAVDSVRRIMKLGFDRLLTSGKANSAEAGISMIKRLVEESSENRKKFIVVAGAGLNERNVGLIVRKTGVKEVHGSAKVKSPSKMVSTPSSVFVGSNAEDDMTHYETSEEQVRKIIAAIRVYQKEISESEQAVETLSMINNTNKNAYVNEEEENHEKEGSPVNLSDSDEERPGSVLHREEEIEDEGEMKETGKDSEDDRNAVESQKQKAVASEEEEEEESADQKSEDEETHEEKDGVSSTTSTQPLLSIFQQVDGHERDGTFLSPSLSSTLEDNEVGSQEKTVDSFATAVEEHSAAVLTPKDDDTSTPQQFDYSQLLTDDDTSGRQDQIHSTWLDFGSDKSRGAPVSSSPGLSVSSCSHEKPTF